MLDGLRGIAIVLVVLSHGWQLWPVAWIDQHALARTVFRSGNASVTVFLLVSGYLTYRALAGSRGLERMRVDVALVRRVLRVGPSLWVMLAVILLVALVDPTDTTSAADDRASVLHVLTYTWNWYVQGNLLTSRPDFGHLWYLSVDMQAFVLMSLLVYSLRRRPVGILFALAGCYLLLTWWRFHVTGTESVFQVLVRTTARMDAFVIGVLVGAAVPLLARLEWDRRWLARAQEVALVLLLPLLWWCAADPLGEGDLTFLGWGGTLLQLDLALVVVTVALVGSSRPVSAVLGAPTIVQLGRSSLLLYIWHYPVFVFTARHTDGWSWELRALVALSATAAISLVADRLVERRVTRALRARWWRRLDDGIPAYAVRRVGATLASLRGR